MGVFKQLGALIGRKAPKQTVVNAPRAATKTELKMHKTQEAAYEEMEKHILAPVIREDKQQTMSEDEIDKKLKELEKQNAFAPDYISMLDNVDVKKPVELDEIGSTLNRPAGERYKPRTNTTAPVGKVETKIDIPRGKCDPGTLADIITV